MEMSMWCPTRNRTAASSQGSGHGPTFDPARGCHSLLGCARSLSHFPGAPPDRHPLDLGATLTRLTARGKKYKPPADLDSEPFWLTKSLDEMSDQEWESLCDGCGRCCLHKLRDEDTDGLVASPMSPAACSTCTLPLRRLRPPPGPGARLRQPDPRGAARDRLAAADLRLSPAAEGSDLAWWHPLVSGDPGHRPQRRHFGPRPRGQRAPRRPAGASYRRLARPRTARRGAARPGSDQKGVVRCSRTRCSAGSTPPC